jgi:transposase-like protein
MRKGDVTCPECSAGYRRIELFSILGKPGQYRCIVCSRVLEAFDGSTEVAYRLTVQPTLAERPSQKPKRPQSINA